MLNRIPDTTAVINYQLSRESKEPIQPQKLEELLKCDEVLQQLSPVLFDKITKTHLLTSLTANIKLRQNKTQNLSVETLHKIFRQLNHLENSVQNSEYKLIIAEYKLLIMENFYNRINPSESLRLQLTNKHALTPLTHYKLRKALYTAILFFGLAQDGIGTFVYSQTVLKLIPGIGLPTTLFFCSVFSILNAILFYSFEGTMLKNAMKVKKLGKESKTFLNLFDEEIDLVQRINASLSDVNNIRNMSSTTYGNNCHLALVFNQDLENTKYLLNQYKEQPHKKIFRWGVTAFGAMMMTGYAYFLSSTLLATLSATVAASPLGWLIIGVAVCSSLAYYFSMRAKAMVSLVNPEMHQCNQIKNRLLSFIPKLPEDFEKIIQDKKEKDALIIENTYSRLNSKPTIAVEPHPPTPNKFFEPARIKQELKHSQSTPSFTLS